MPDTQVESLMELRNPGGLRAAFHSNGSLQRLEHAAVLVNLFPGNEVEGGPANLYLRDADNPAAYIPLLGPRSPSRFACDAAGSRLTGSGVWGDIRYRLDLVLAAQRSAWFWHLRIRNAGTGERRIDVTYAQDLALAAYFAVRLNEFYVSQYIDHTPLAHPSRGVMIASRQNQSVDGRNAWTVIGSLRNASAFATDALQFQGLAGRAGGPPVGLVGELPSRRLQHEHSMAVVRDAPLRLPAGGSAATGFFGLFVEDHPEATSIEDLKRVEEVLRLSEATPPAPDAPDLPAAATNRSSASLFCTADPLRVRDLDAGELKSHFGDWRHEETEGGERLALICEGHRQVALRAKELRVLRPHGCLLRTGRHLTPDETSLTTTVWMDGVFNSMLTQGHVSINRVLSTVHSYLGLFRSHGQRVFMRSGAAWKLLAIPSAFEMSPACCRWIYAHDAGTVEVVSKADTQVHELTLSIEVTAGEPAEFLISHHSALNGDDGSAPGKCLWHEDGAELVLTPAPGSDLAQRFPQGSFRIAPAPGTRIRTAGGDELLFADGRSRQQPFLCLLTEPSHRVELRMRGALVSQPEPRPLLADSAEALAPRIAVVATPACALAQPMWQLTETLPWFAHDALVHYLAPRGLEQYSGGGWGTRDVCQGPVELLLALDRPEAVRDLLLRVLAMQNPDGDWPQWFMFFERERNIRAGDSHGDIVFWPLVVLAQYLIATADAALLTERIAFFDARGPSAGESVTVWVHVLRALALIEQRVIPGTSLAAYGHGDWNDSLQPADPAMRAHMCSAWTVSLHFQTLTGLARALRVIGRNGEASRFDAWAQRVLADFQRLLIVDGVLTGYADFEDGKAVRYLLHPRDPLTGVQYSSLAMIHAILEDMLTPAQTAEHLRLIRQHISAADGVRLFDRPMRYRGGPQKLFQRAETATYFGREIGLMYMHAHLRFAQALAHVGRAEEFFHALCQANPLGVRAIVPNATLRQSNCYYSSSDAAFADRYEASEQYARIGAGTIAIDGGWRVYSSGAGIAAGLIVRRFLGLDWQHDGLNLDPVIPAALDGLRIATVLKGRDLEIHYRIKAAGSGVRSVALNGAPLAFTPRPNRHRGGAALLAREELLSRFTSGRNTLDVSLD